MAPGRCAAQTGCVRKSLQLEQDPRFQRRSWYAERAGWAVMALAVIGALAGLFGSGPLSGARTASVRGELAVEYQRFARSKAPVTLRLEFSEQVARRGQVRLWIARGYLEAMKVEHILPEPAQVEVAGERLVYVFALGAAGGGGSVSFRLKPDGFGMVRGSAGVEGGEEVRFRHLVYP
jgi:hypothetical protein